MQGVPYIMTMKSRVCVSGAGAAPYVPLTKKKKEYQNTSASHGPCQARAAPVMAYQATGNTLLVLVGKPTASRAFRIVLPHATGFAYHCSLQVFYRTSRAKSIL